jgi:2',3'-cyclic-nucleotide 2'-phosphodiesterase (5'-nucleotidase family)
MARKFPLAAARRPARPGLSVEALEARDVPAFTLQILHASDFEAGLSAAQDAPRFAAVVDWLEDTYPNTVRLSSGDNYIPGPFFNAGGDPALGPVLGAASVGRADVEVLNRIGIEASAVGNHEFDAGPREVRNIIASSGAWRGAQFPYLTSNITFAAPNDIAAPPPNLQVAGGQEANTVRGRIAPSAVITVNGEPVGLVGVTTPLQRSLTTLGPAATVLPTDLGDDPEDMAALAAVVQPAVDALTAAGVDKVVLLSHLQDLDNELELGAYLRGVDVIVGGGSNRLLADDTDRLRPGDAREGDYPTLITDPDGRLVPVVNTDGNYKYVGQLVVTFDDAGELIPDPDGAGPLLVGGIDPAVGGAFAADDRGVIDLWGSLEAAFAPGTKGAAVKEVTDAVDAVIRAKDGTIFGRTDVYLNGLRGEVRNQETNLGSLSADANLFAARRAGRPAVVSIKNGGGIRDSIGSIDPDTGERRPPAANPAAGKEFGDISRLDIENSLRFNNTLSVLDVTATGLRQVIEHGVAVLGSQGRFPQVGGLAFSYDPGRAAGDRVRTLVLTDEAGNVLDVVVRDGAVVGNPNRPVRVVTLGFLADGGDGYPFPTLGRNRVNLGVGEQQALADYLTARHADAPFARPDTPPELDRRIQNLAVRPDTVGGVVVDNGTAQRSVVRSLTVTVRGEVAAVLPGAFRLNGADVTASASAPAVGGGATTFVITFPPGGLADGVYTLAVDGSNLLTAGGEAVDADEDGSAGGVREVRFFRLFGDTDGNGAVDGRDLALARRVFADPARYAAQVYLFDLNGDGVLTADEQAAFRANLGKRIRL